jgi:transcription-repair coupling factor (superfamily II helicase)
VETQLSTEQVKKISIMPNVENKKLNETRESFLKYVSAKTVVFVKNMDLLSAQMDKLFEKAVEAFQKLPGEVKHGEPKSFFVMQKHFRSN